MIKEATVNTTLEFSGTLEFLKRFLILSHTPSFSRGLISKRKQSIRYTSTNWMAGCGELLGRNPTKENSTLISL